jgi:hypothetical protein
MGILVVELITKYGCRACKNRETDEFLDQTDRFWCKREKMVIASGDAHIRCQHWQFCGSGDLIKGLHQPELRETEPNTVQKAARKLHEDLKKSGTTMTMEHDGKAVSIGAGREAEEPNPSYVGVPGEL